MGWLTALVLPAEAYDTRYHGSEGFAAINAVAVEDAFFWAKLDLVDPQRMVFELAEFGPAAGTLSGGATLDGPSGALRLPRTLAGRQFWDVRLDLLDVPGPIRFRLSSAIPNPYSVNRGRASLNPVASTGVDSIENPDGSGTRIRSHRVGKPRYGEVSPRTRDGQPVVVPYMVHEAEDGPAKALCLLIPGGALTAYLQGDTETGSVRAAGGNFLVRSAHLFAELGCRAVSIDRPSDWSWYEQRATVGLAQASRMDTYRVSADHRTDIQAVLAVLNEDNLPVVILGTSRGAVSAYTLSALADAVAISSPVGPTARGGYPVGSPNSPPSLQLDAIHVPVHLLYHEQDACVNTLPHGTVRLFHDLSALGKDVTLQGLSGGFDDDANPDPCGAFSYHGFMGIESGAVAYTMAWIDDVLRNR